MRRRSSSAGAAPDGEVVTAGIPLPRNVCWSTNDVSVVNATGTVLPLQLTVLDRWPDGSLRWVLVDLVTDTSSMYRLRLFGGPERPAVPTALDVLVDGQRVTVRTASQTFLVAPADHLFETRDRRGQRLTPYIVATDASGTTTRAVVTSVAVERSGPLRAVVVSRGTIAIGESRLAMTSRLHFSATSSALRIDLSILNPRAAAHPGNFWELGDRNSVLFEDLSIRVDLPSTAHAVTCIPEPGARAMTDSRLTLYQDSSGGDNWRSRVHVNREGRVPIRFNGFRLEGTQAVVEGRRASPVMETAYAGGTVAIAVRHFWQNFPKGLEGDASGVTVGLFPHQWDDLHELQGGERKTHTASLGFDSPFPDALRPMLDPGVLSCEPDWYERCEVVTGLTPARASAAPDYEKLIDAAIEGDDTFAGKRERIDEYGWRNFGDLYADHEAVGHQGETPVVSHYNNQYDAIAGFAIQFMRSGDLRWFSAMEELATHVTDIDLYHTDEDKSAFNHGLFWHTAHYIDAGRSTHRTYPHAPGVSGGGPSNEHDYSTGLLLHFLLTGDERSREGVMELVNWVTIMDEGRRTVFRFLSRADTGLASSTLSPHYHGPGRGAGNSIATLLNGFRLSADRRFLEKAESLIFRCIHPADDLRGNDLLDAERRWSYTVFLQALGTYLHAKSLLGEMDQQFAYARDSLVHYGRWMAVHEYPYLDTPDALEYPNETWAAQDIRKAEVFATVARYGSGDERALMLERSRFFFASSVSGLMEADTRTLTRPVTILLSNGHNIATLQRADPAIRHDTDALNHRLRRVFVPQKIEAVRNGLFLSAFAALLIAVLITYIWAQYRG